MCVLVTGADSEGNTVAITTIGMDAIRGETEMCIFAIGLGQLIGKCVGRDKRTGRFVSLTKRTVIGAYTDVEPVELERRANPRKAPAVAARLVIGLALAVVTTAAHEVASAARIAAWLVSAGVRTARSVAGYVNRECVQQWGLVLVFAPACAFLVWVWLVER
jgi:hypothetical protein